MHNHREADLEVEADLEEQDPQIREADLEVEADLGERDPRTREAGLEDWDPRTREADLEERDPQTREAALNLLVRVVHWDQVLENDGPRRLRLLQHTCRCRVQWSLPPCLCWAQLQVLLLLRKGLGAVLEEPDH